MRKIRNKLNSRSGASLLIALLYLLVALVVGTVVLTAANVGTSRIASERSRLQGQLAVESAVKLLAQDVCSGSFTGQYLCGTVDSYTPALYADDAAPEDPPIREEVSETTDIPPQNRCSPIYGNGLSGSSKMLDEFETTLVNNYLAETGSFSDFFAKGQTYACVFSAENMPDVTCEMTMHTDYSIEALLYLSDEPDSGRVSVIFAPMFSNDSDSQIENGEIANADGSTTFLITKTMIYTTSVSWNTPSVSKVITKGATATS